MSAALAPLPPENHRFEREAGAIVYPVISRRSKGLSLGVNLFPDRKLCSFDCPYCEVFPFETDIPFSLPAMEEGLRERIGEARATGLEIRDISFSGNGEPTLSPDFSGALTLAASIRDALCPSARLVVITNASTLGDPPTADFLARTASPRPAGLDLDIWMKLDAGSPDWYQKIDRAELPYETLVSGIEAFVSHAPVTIQTMICAVEGVIPPDSEAAAWEILVSRLCAASKLSPSAGIRRIQLYGKARPAPEDPLSSRLPVEILEKRAESLRQHLAFSGFAVPVEVFP